MADFLTDIAAVSAGYSPLRGRLIIHYQDNKSAMLKFNMFGVIVIDDKVLNPSKGSDFYKMIGEVLAGEDVYFSSGDFQYKLTVSGQWVDVLTKIYAERETSYWRNSHWRFWTCLGNFGRLTNGASGAWVGVFDTEPVQ